MNACSRSPRPAAVAIVGPTAVGKTEIAVALAEQLQTEIISCDAMQVYREFRVLTARPASHGGVWHHAAGFASVSDKMTVARWRDEARSALSLLWSQERVPLIVGGTGLYLRALIDGLNPAPSGNEAMRQRLLERMRLEGTSGLYEELCRVDPVSAARIHPHDLKRILRALEVYHLSGRPLSAHHRDTRGGLKEEADVLILGLTAPRPILHRRIEERVERMLQQGALEEVRDVMEKTISPTAEAVIGFQEIRDFWRGECLRENVHKRMVVRTRRYARRQWIWFRADERVVWFVRRGDETAGVVVERMGSWIKAFLEARRMGS